METVTIFNALTVPYAVIFHIALFSVLNEFRYPAKKSAILTVLLNIPVLAITFLAYAVLGSERGGQLALFFYVIPQIFIFLAISKYRDGRFLSTFFFAQGIDIFIIQITNLIDFYSPYDNHIVMFITRLIIYPVSLLLMIIYVRKPYLRAMSTIKSGWNMFGCISMFYTLLLLIFFNYPSTLSKRPGDIPSILLIFILMLLTNLYYIQTLLRQEDYYHEKDINQMLELQMEMMKQRIDQTAEEKKSISIIRHDLRHILTTLNGMISGHDTDAAKAYIENSIGVIDTDSSEKWCPHPVLNAMFSSYFGSAKKQNIKIEAKLDFSDITDTDAAALSLVFANAIENAIQAVKELPEKQRFIHAKALSYPKLMFSVSNPYEGDILLDENGIPVSKKSGHGIGIRSILAWCEKNNATCDFKIQDNYFTLRIVRN